MAKGILIAAMNFSDVAEDEFHDWYDTEHVPERLAVPGFLNAERWIGISDPRISVALYDLDNCRGAAQPALSRGRRRQRLALDQAGDRPRQAHHADGRRADPARRCAGPGRRARRSC